MQRRALNASGEFAGLLTARWANDEEAAVARRTGLHLLVSHSTVCLLALPGVSSLAQRLYWNLSFDFLMLLLRRSDLFSLASLDFFGRAGVACVGLRGGQCTPKIDFRRRRDRAEGDAACLPGAEDDRWRGRMSSVRVDVRADETRAVNRTDRQTDRQTINSMRNIEFRSSSARGFGGPCGAGSRLR